MDNLDKLNANEKFLFLREKYRNFIYHGYSYAFTDSSLQVKFDFEIEGLEKFAPTWSFPLYSRDSSDAVYERNFCIPTGNRLKILEKLIFSLGMVEAISYYKISCPTNFIVECGYIDKETGAWWRKLIFNGLGEFIYRNDIKISCEELLHFDIRKKCSDEEYEVLSDKESYRGCLVPVGGGKDSCVTLDLLKDGIGEVSTVVINGNGTTKSVIEKWNGNVHNNSDYILKRTLDKRMLELNNMGYLNGHTPFSACVAFSTMIQAFLLKKKYIVLSNENSANESTVMDSSVNHQYSKSFEFEKDFMAYIRKISDSGIHYFSLLRPWTELQIAAYFSKLEVFHPVFRSCNAGSKKGIWCNACSKCLFVYIILSPFLQEREMVGIFGENLLEKSVLEEDFRKLLGIDRDKPFECVGTRREVGIALKSFVQAGGKSFLTEKYREYILGQPGDLQSLLGEWNREHNLPEKFEKLLMTETEVLKNECGL